jgi:hypothetical protein
MKTRILIILSLIAMNISFVFAENDTRKSLEGPTANDNAIFIESLAPVTPPEATFEDSSELHPVVSLVVSLAPEPPKDASFEESATGNETISKDTFPVNQKIETNKKEQNVHPAFPKPCDVKYGCGL